LGSESQHSKVLQNYICRILSKMLMIISVIYVVVEYLPLLRLTLKLGTKTKTKQQQNTKFFLVFCFVFLPGNYILNYSWYNYFYNITISYLFSIDQWIWSPRFVVLTQYDNTDVMFVELNKRDETMLKLTIYVIQFEIPGH
jgi:hypothetical protein